MTVTLDRVNTAKTIEALLASGRDIITVADRAGLLALPEGTIVSDRDGDRYIRTENEFRDYYDDGPCSEEDAAWIAEYQPVIVLNPEVLGEFAPTFEVGQRVRITGGVYNFIGLEAIVGDGTTVASGPHRDGVIELLPQSNRPDGFRRSAFWYDCDQVELVEPQIEVGSRVEVREGEEVWDLDFTHIPAGVAGVVTSKRSGLGDYLVEIEFDNGQRIGGWYAYRFQLTDRPAPVEPLMVQAESDPVVHDREGLDALPNGSVLVNEFGDVVITKIANRWFYTGFGSEAFVSDWTSSMYGWVDAGSEVFIVKHFGVHD